MKFDYIKPEYIECGCHAELLQLQYWKDDDLLYLSMFTIGKRKDNNNGFTLKEKIKHIWYILKYGHPFSDGIVMKKEDRKKLKKYLMKIDKE